MAIGEFLAGQDGGQESPQVNDEQGLRKQWGDFLGDPGTQAFLVQAGLQMMQPYAPGQTGVGAMAHSIGTGLEAKDRTEQNIIKEEDKEAKRQLEQQALGIDQQRADASTMSAQASQTRAGAAATRAGRVSQSQQYAAVKNHIIGKILRGEELDPGEIAARDLMFRDPLGGFGAFVNQGGAASNLTGPKTFNSVEDYEAAFESGDVQIGDEVIVDGRRAVVEE